MALAVALPGSAAVWQAAPVSKQLVMEVTFETPKDYDITSAYAVRGWNTTEGHMRMVCPSEAASHTGKAGLEVDIERAFDKNFHAQFSLPHLTAQKSHSAYELTFWARASGGSDVLPEVSFLDVDEGYDWIGGAQVALSQSWQHIAMAPVATGPQHKGHEIQVAFLIGEVAAQFFFDDIELYELDVPSPPPPSPPPPPSYLLWLDGAKAGVPVESTGRVTIAGKEVPDGATLGSFGVRAGATVDMTRLGLVGGMLAIAAHRTKRLRVASDARARDASDASVQAAFATKL